VILTQEGTPAAKTRFWHYLRPGRRTRHPLDPRKDFELAFALDYSRRWEADVIEVAQEIMDGWRPELHRAPDGVAHAFYPTGHRVI
jgi:hypothetical protein